MKLLANVRRDSAAPLQTDPPRYLRRGDRLRCEIEGIGGLENSVVDQLPRADEHAVLAGVAELRELAR